MSTAVRALHLVGEHALRSIEERVSRSLAGWCRDWVREPMPEPQVSVQALTGASPRMVDCIEIGGATGRVWIRASADDRNGAARAVLGDEFLPLATAGDAWSREALSRAIEQRNQSLAQTLIGDVHASMTRPADPSLYAFASGAVQITCEALGVHLLADCAVLQHVPPHAHTPAVRPAPESLKEAAREAPLTLTVGLGSVELDIAHLFELQPGDVICLPTRLADRLPVMLDGKAVAQGALGHCGQRKAVHLVSL
jgi:flagellar motor switch/type III secretory pathway protein FliN